MKAKDYLKQIEICECCINQKTNELRDLENKMKQLPGIDYANTKPPNGGKVDARYTKLITQKVDLEHEIEHDVVKYMKLKELIINQIQKLNNPIYIKILYKRYVEYKSFERIAREVYYTYQYIRHLHCKALIEFEKINIF